ncbi:HD domain-containing protein [Candidatus Roizmanbacteria bacterium]|nr:HD domain-containing protein [Candidatus Roizmanbacteria bacterium]
MTSVEMMRRPSWAMEIMGRLRHHNIKIYRHSIRVGFIAQTLKSDINNTLPHNLYLAGLLHDCGKLEISAEVLDKERTSVTVDDEVLIGKHPYIGSEMVAKYDRSIADIIQGHHRWGNNTESHPLKNGSAKKSYFKIELEQMMLAVADKADVLINRTKGLNGVQVNEMSLSEFINRFQKEIDAGLIQKNHLLNALMYAWNIGARQGRILGKFAYVKDTFLA